MRCRQQQQSRAGLGVLKSACAARNARNTNDPRLHSSVLLRTYYSLDKRSSYMTRCCLLLASSPPTQRFRFWPDGHSYSYS